MRTGVLARKSRPKGLLMSVCVRLCGKQPRYDHFSGEKSEEEIKYPPKVPERRSFGCIHLATPPLFSIHQGKGDRREVDSIQATDIDCHHLLAAWSDSLRERSDAALAAEQVVNYPLFELVVDQSLGPSPPREALRRYECPQRTALDADRAVARVDLAEVRRHLETHLPAMAAARIVLGVRHGWS